MPIEQQLNVKTSGARSTKTPVCWTSHAGIVKPAMSLMQSSSEMGSAPTQARTGRFMESSTLVIAPGEELSGVLGMAVNIIGMGPRSEARDAEAEFMGVGSGALRMERRASAIFRPSLAGIFFFVCFLSSFLQASASSPACELARISKQSARVKSGSRR